MSAIHAICVRFCITLFFVCFFSSVFAQITPVPNRATLGATDSIDWQKADDGSGDYTFISIPSSIDSTGGEAILVNEPYSIVGLIITEPSPYFVDTNLPDGDYLFHTYTSTNDTNPVSFSYNDGHDFCGLGTQVAPYDPGVFIARIEAFNVGGESMGWSDVTGSSEDSEAAYIGISSAEPMNRVEISLLSTGDGAGQLGALFVLNKVDFKACADDPPQVPNLLCDGFASPMYNHPVKSKKNRAFPLKMELFDEYGIEQTDLELIMPPVVTVMFTASNETTAIDVSDAVLATGLSSEGNQFVFTDDGVWQFNLKSNNYTAEGMYEVTVVSGDNSEYTINPSCKTSFIK